MDVYCHLSPFTNSFLVLYTQSLQATTWRLIVSFGCSLFEMQFLHLWIQKSLAFSCAQADHYHWNMEFSRRCTLQTEDKHMSLMSAISWRPPFIDFLLDSSWMTWTESSKTYFGLSLCSVSWVDKIRQLLSSFCVGKTADSCVCFYHSGVGRRTVQFYVVSFPFTQCEWYLDLLTWTGDEKNPFEFNRVGT